MLPEHIGDAALNLLVEKLGQSIDRVDFKPTSGGCINNGGQLITSAGNFFIKYNDDATYPEMFKKEAKGLTILKDVNAIRIPEVIGHGKAAGQAFLILEFIQSASVIDQMSELFGEELAAIHKHTTAQFGLDHHNYIGSLLQFNSRHDDFITFFIEERLEKQLTLGFDKRLIGKAHVKNFQKLYNKLEEMIPVEKPALLHGDLWSGNYMLDEQGKACLIDPAVCYGHRESELSFTKMFGGFEKAFYSSYYEAFPLEPGFEERVDIYNLYPLLVHLNLFGRRYLGQIETILKRF